jgi:hypothetical protein
VVDLFRDANLSAQVEAVVVTGGHDVTTGEDGAWHIPKKELCSTIQLLLQDHRLQVAAHPERERLTNELLNFRAKIHLSTSKESVEEWRERDHDDLVLAVALDDGVSQELVTKVRSHQPQRRARVRSIPEVLRGSRARDRRQSAQSASDRLS